MILPRASNQNNDSVTKGSGKKCCSSNYFSRCITGLSHDFLWTSRGPTGSSLSFACFVNLSVSKRCIGLNMGDLLLLVETVIGSNHRFLINAIGRNFWYTFHCFLVVLGNTWGSHQTRDQIDLMTRYGSLRAHHGRITSLSAC